MKKYDKIYWLGHVTLYRNTPEINALGLKNHKYPTATYRQAFSTPYNYHFIEGGGMYLIAKMSGLRCYEGIEFADIAVEYYNFVLAWKENGHLPGIIKWQNGILTWVYLENNKIQEEEISYVHLQKRKMTVEVSSPQNGFLIVPNRFIDIQEITPEFILANAQDTVEWHREYKKKLAKYYLETIKQGGIKIKIDKIIRKLRYQ